MGRGAKGNMPLAAEEAGGGVHADPASARKVNLRPGVQIGEVLVRAHRPFDRVHIGLQLDEIAGHETGREAQIARDLHQEPGRVAAGARSQSQRILGRLNAGLHADDIADVALEPRVERHQKVDGAHARPCEAGDHRADQRAGRLGRQIGGQLMGQLRLVGEGEGLGIGLDEEVERVDHVHIGLEVDLDAELLGLLGEDVTRQPVAVRILLPVHEMLGGEHLQRIAGDLGSAVRRWPQPDHLRPKAGQAVVFVMGDVMEGDRDRHGRGSIVRA